MPAPFLTVADKVTRALVLEVLRAGAEQRRRTASRAAATMAPDDADGALALLGLLAEAGRLDSVARALELGTDVPLATATDPAAPPADADDSVSPEADALAELAGLEPTVLGGEEDELGALPEDEVGDVEDAAALALGDPAYLDRNASGTA